MESAEDRYPASRCGTGRSMDNPMAGRAAFSVGHNDLANNSPLESGFEFALEAHSLHVSSMFREGARLFALGRELQFSREPFALLFANQPRAAYANSCDELLRRISDLFGQVLAERYST